jgi:hypothetical protein
VVTFKLDFDTALADEDRVEGLSNTKLQASDGSSILHENDVLVGNYRKMKDSAVRLDV